MKIDKLEIRNAKYNENGDIDCEVLIDDLSDYIPFTASPNDAEIHGRAIFEALSRGIFGDVAEYGDVN